MAEDDEHYLSISWAGVTTLLMPKTGNNSKQSQLKPLIVRASPLKPQKPSTFLKYIPKFQALRNYYGFWSLLKDKHTGKGEGKTERYIDLDFIPGGELDRILFIPKPENGPFPIEGYDEAQKLIILYGTAKLIEFMHSLGLVHGDISPYTIFLDHEFHPIIAPIRVSYKFCRAGSGIPRVDCVAPEIVNNCLDPETVSTTKSDVYMIGMTILAVAKHGYPYEEEKKICVVDKIKNNELPNIPDSVRNSPLFELYQKCVKSNPDERIEISEVVNDLHKIGSKYPKFKQYATFLNSKIGKVVEKKPFGGEKLLGTLQNFENAAKKKIPFAMETLGEMLMEGEIVKKNEAKGEEMLNELEAIQGTDEEEEETPEEEDTDDDDDEPDDDDDDDEEFDDDGDDDDDEEDNDDE